MEVVNQDYVEYLQTLFQSLEPIYRFTFSPNTDSDAPYVEEDISTFGTHEQGRVTFYSKEYGECEKGIVNFVMDYWVMNYNDEPSVITAIHISSHFGDTEIELDNCFLPNQEKFKFFMENALDYVAHELYWTKQGEKDIRIMKAVL